MLKAIRVTLALLCVVAVTLLFVDFSGYAASHWSVLARMQLVPALLSANLVAIVAVVALTLLLGRVYCSVICPLGVLQDVFTRLRTWLGGRRRAARFAYKPAHQRTRAVIACAFGVLLALGAASLIATWAASLIEPYSAYGRISSQIFAPAWRWADNALASVAESHDSYAFVPVAMQGVNLILLTIAVVTLLTIAVMAWKGGRTYCNTVCPVGTVLGWLSRHALIKIRIDDDKCVSCGRCGRYCKASCIDTRNHRIDYSRCVACMDCLSKCSTGAISYSAMPLRQLKRKEHTAEQEKLTDEANSRRAFITTGVAIAAAATGATAAARGGHGGMATLTDKKPAQRKVPIVPAGALSLSHLAGHCTACQLCIQNCPTGVLHASTSIEHLMQPELDYTAGYCRPDCTRCSNLCPTGALTPVDEIEKSSIKVGTAVVDVSICLAAQGQHCGQCARRCPASAITMHHIDGESPRHRRPVVDPEACIGCGACEYYCPVGTVEGLGGDHAAIHVEGIEVHRTI